MKVFITLAVLATFAIPTSVSAKGMPSAHGVDGRTFGSLVSELAQTNPEALASHVSIRSENNRKGMPSIHGVDGRTFGSLVSELAQTNPEALASHVRGR